MKLIKSLSKLVNARIAKFGLEEQMGLPYWREKLFQYNMLVLLSFGLFAYVPGVWVSIQSGMYYIAVGDTIFLLLLALGFFLSNLSFRVRSLTLITLVYFLGVFLLLALGPFGPGLVWLIGFSIIAGLFLEVKLAVISVVLNFLTIVGLGVLVHLRMLDTIFFRSYDFDSWIAVGLNLVVVNIVSTMSVAIILRGLQRSLNKEIELKSNLEQDGMKLKEALRLAEESEKIKSAFLANMSHEIRTPLNAIIGFSELIQEDIAPENQEQYVQLIQQNSDDLLSLINDILDLSRIQAGSFHLKKEHFHLSVLLEEACMSGKLLLKRRKKEHLTLGKITGTMEKDLIYSDKQRLRQVINNLMDNAIKFTEEGSVTIILEWQGGNFLLGVKDTGVGIENEEIKNLFSRFYKGNTSAVKIYDGAGLGLSISKNIVEFLGGTIWVESEPNQGATFWILLPSQ